MGRLQHQAKRMLDARELAGDDVELELAVPSPQWAFRRGDSTLVCALDVLNSDAVAQLLAQATVLGVAHCIVVYIIKCTAQGKKDAAASDAVAIEHFSADELALCPLDWSVQSQYRLLTTPPTEPAVNLARIWTTDPVVRYYGAKIGEVFEIVNTWGTLPPETTYRVVTAPVGA